MLQSPYAVRVLGLLLAVSPVVGQTTTLVEPLPPPDPGYRLYFHGDAGELEKPIRWGYHDGWMQGRADRNGGQSRDPHQEDAYRKGRLHGGSGTVAEELYLRSYRSAYLRGYEHGFRI